MGWNLEQEQYLVDNYGKIKTKDIIKQLQKSATDIHTKANRLGLEYKPKESKGIRLETYTKAQQRKAKVNETKELIDNTLQRLGV
jgi:hypothetical protein